jgi:hypothetical protein
MGAFGLLFACLGAKRVPEMIGTVRRNWRILLALECLVLLGQVVSQRAIELAPSVSYVAAIEALLPIYVMGIAWIFVLVSRLRGSSALVEKVFSEGALDHPARKLLATVIMAAGVYIIS